MAETETTIAPLTLTKEQAAAVLNVRVDTVLHASRKGGTLPFVKIGKHRRWLLADLQELSAAPRKRPWNTPTQTVLGWPMN